MGTGLVRGASAAETNPEPHPRVSAGRDSQTLPGGGWECGSAELSVCGGAEAASRLGHTQRDGWDGSRLEPGLMGMVPDWSLNGWDGSRLD